VLSLVELRKADRLGQLPAALAVRVILCKHRQQDAPMSKITGVPTRAAVEKREALGADAEARRLAFVRERALHDTLARNRSHSGSHRSAQSLLRALPARSRASSASASARAAACWRTAASAASRSRVAPFRSRAS